MADEPGASGVEEYDVGVDIQSVTEGAGLFAVGKLVNNLLGLIINTILTRMLGAEVFGLYTYSLTITAITSTLSRFGANDTLTRLLPMYDDPEQRNEVISMNIVSAVLASSVLAGVLAALAPMLSLIVFGDTELAPVLRLLALTLPFTGLISVATAVFKATENLKYQVLTRDILQPLVWVVTLTAVGFISATVISVAVARLGLELLVAIVSFTLIYARFSERITIPSDTDTAREFFRYSVPLTLRDVGLIMYNRADLLIVGLLLTKAGVGIYRIAFLVAGFAAMPLYGFNQLFPPIASRLHSNGRRDELQTVYSTVTRWSLTLSLIITLGGVIYATEILRLFGEEFTAGVSVLSIIIFSKFVNASVGPSGLLLTMTDHQKFASVIQWVYGLANVGLNVVLIFEFGLVGAAVATGLTTVAQNLTLVYFADRYEGYMPYTTAFLKPFAAGIAAATVMQGASAILDGLWLLAVGGLTGTVTYFAILYALGIEDEDKELARNVLHT